MRVGKTNALFQPRADTGQPVVSAGVPRARRKALWTWPAIPTGQYDEYQFC
jgi:hypothetical protein